MTEKTAPAGVYVHFPWCLAKCPYCDFVSYSASRESIDHAAYADAVIREIEARAPNFAGRQVKTVFFGGGTPSLWDPRELGRVVARVRERLCRQPPRSDGAQGASPPPDLPVPDLEVTVECNPTSLSEDVARALLDVGVNRLSIGVQSLRDDRLRYLGRLHDASGAREAVRGAMRAGMTRVSADLIFGTPGQSAGEARDEALELAHLGLSHMSAYQLTIEPGTRFGELARRGRLPLADDGIVAEAFLAIDDALTALGLRHYEVSNFARPGEEARHNLGYWRGDEYLGLGCAAFGFVRRRGEEAATGHSDKPSAQGVRYRNAVLPERFVESTLQAASDGGGISESSEPLDAPTLLRERIMLGLRVDGGIDIAAAAAELGAPGWTTERIRAAEWLEERGRIVRSGPRVSIPHTAWLWTDDTAARLF
ncbi:MAG TPA: radical SAM family heme chaperone HemW [Polyangiaceae bacterium]|nr:radical SAM family heme chaperone HemW [Polyangiaceae bacterium]